MITRDSKVFHYQDGENTLQFAILRWANPRRLQTARQHWMQEPYMERLTSKLVSYLVPVLPIFTLQLNEAGREIKGILE